MQQLEGNNSTWITVQMMLRRLNQNRFYILMELLVLLAEDGGNFNDYNARPIVLI